MKSSIAQKTIFTLMFLGLPLLVGAANVSLTTSDPLGTSSFNSAGKWNNGQAPNPTNDYFTGPYFMRTPVDSGNTTWTFAGHSLTLSAPGAGVVRSIIVKSGNNDTFVINNLTNAAGGVLENGGSGNVVATFTGNQFTIAANSMVYADQGSLIIGYPLVGAEGVILTNAGGNANGITYNNDNSAFKGKFYTSTANFGNGGGNTTIILNAPNSAPGNPSTFTPDQIRLAAGCTLRDNYGLTLNNPNSGITLAGNATISAMATTVLGEPITDVTNGVSSVATLTSGGTGILVLSNANNNWSGGTTISAGTLQIGLAGALPAGNVTNNGTLDLNTFSVTIGGLNGSGTVDTFAGGTPTLTLGANNAGGTFSGTIGNSQGTLSLLKIGGGTQTLAGGYTYSGSTRVAGGTLVISTANGIVPFAPGDLIVSNGATLAVNASSGVTLPANNVVAGTNATLNLTLNSSASALNVNGNLTLQDHAVISLNYGTLSGNPAASAINVSGGLVAAGTNIVLAVSGIGFQPGTFTLIKYSGTPLASLANFTLQLSPGVFGTLVNNTANDSIDLNVAGVAQQLVWNGVNGTSWDLTTSNWLNPLTGQITVFRQYTNGNVIGGDGVTFDDTLTNDFVHPQPTNVVLNSQFYVYPFVVNSTVPYTIAGAGGILGTTSLVKSNTGSLTLLTSNSFTGGVFVNDAGTLIITNDAALGASGTPLTLNGSTLQINGNLTNNRPISVPAAATIGVGTNFTASLNGVVSGTRLNKTDGGTLILGNNSVLSGGWFVHNGTLIVDSGAVLTNNNYIDVGQNGTDNATLTLRGTGRLVTTSDFNVGDLDSSTGTLNIQDSASLQVNQFFVGSANASGSTASGTVNQTGGTVTEVSTAVGAVAIGGRTSNQGVGVYNLSGGTFTANAGIRVGGSGTGTVNQTGGTINALGGINIARLSGSSGTYNLNGGTLATYNVATSTGVNAIFNFNGGTLLAAFNPPSATWFSGGIQANVLSGGAIIDSSNYNVTISVPLLAGNPSGGLTKKGSGTLTLSGVNTFTGPITVNGGSLILNSASSYPGGATVNAGTLQMTTASSLGGTTTVNDGAVLSIVQNGSGTESLGNLTLNGGGTVPGATLALAVTAANNPSAPFVNCGTLTLNGNNTIALVGAVKVGTLALIRATGAIAGSGTLTNLSLPQGVVGSITTHFDGTYTTVSAVITSTGPGLVWSGTNSAAPNVWDINTTTNWLLNATPTTYQQTIIPGDAVTFNDVGSGTVLLSNTVGPSSLTISNNAKTYTFSGSGAITGPTGLLKLGSGTALINLTNNSYSGDTVIGAGTLQLGSPLAISPAANLTVGAGGTLELAGVSTTAGELTGSGVIDNNSGNNVTLTVGSSAGGVWNGTIQDHGAGGVNLHKVGSGTWLVGGANSFNDGQPFNDKAQITSGTTVITNGGLLGFALVELQIANGAGATGQVVVAGGTLAVSNNVLSIGYGDNTANGTLIVNSGTVLHGGGASSQFGAIGANFIDVGAQGATGTLIVNGGQVLNTQGLYLGDGAGANGTLHLNGGLLQASVIQPNGTPASSIAYFNGGTLQAVTNSSDFIVGTTPYLQSGGLIFDDGGWAVSMTSQGFQDDPGSPGGPLIKTGNGVLYLDGNNTFTGTTIVTNGTLGGVGTLTGPVVVAPNGNLAPGDAGALAGGILYINSGLTLQGKVTFRISNNGGFPNSDQIQGPTTVNYGGTLVITNVTSDGTLLTNGETFPLFTAASHTGNFASIVGSPGAGLAYQFDPATGKLTVVTSTARSVPRITNISLSGTTLTISGTNGTANGTYVLLGSTNVALPLSQWTPLLTNSFDGSGNLNLQTNIVNPALPNQFYILSQ